MSRSLMFQSKLPLFFWTFAVEHASFLHNRLFSQTTNTTPFQKLHNRNPDISFIRNFGCQVFYLKPTHTHEVFRPTSEKGIFLGYQKDTKGNLIYDMPSQKIILSADVRFQENVFPGSGIPNPILTSPNDYFEESTVTNTRDLSFGTNMQTSLDITDPIIEQEIVDHHSAEVLDRNDILITPVANTHDTNEVDTNLLHDDAEELFQDSLEELPVNQNYVLEADPVDEIMETITIKEGTTTQTPLRRSQRILNKTICEKTKEVIANHLTVNEFTIESPTSLQDAMKSNNWPNWKSAMQDEIDNFYSLNAFEEMPLPTGAKAINSRWVFSHKTNDSGVITAFKARFVAKGFTQRPMIDYTEVFAPVAITQSTRLLLSVAASNDWEIDHLDVRSAFLNANIDQEIYIYPPTNYQSYSADGTKLFWKMKKAIYGLKQSSRLWFITCRKLLCDYGFQVSASDPCIFVYRESGGIAVIDIHVDDMILATSLKMTASAVKEYLMDKLPIKDLGANKNFLGVNMERNYEERTIRLSQGKYIDSALKKFNMNNAKPSSTPIQSNVAIPIYNPEEPPYTAPYMEAVGSLIYLVTWTRPDIAYAVSIVGQFNAGYNHIHWSMVQRILRYLAGTRQYALELGGIIPEGTKNPIEGFSDADYAGDKEDFKSRSGMLVTFNKRPIFWKTKKQSIVAKSTTSAEIIAAGVVADEIKWTMDMLNDLGMPTSEPTVLNMDNQASISICSGISDIQQVKSIATHFQSLREYTATNLLKLIYCNTKNMVADIFTKALGSNDFSRCLNSLKLSNQNLA